MLKLPRNRVLIPAAALLVLFGVAVVFRFLWLETVPGINGDEAWMGWKVCRAWAGEPLSWRSYSNNISNPFFLAPLFLVHGVLEPGGFALRVVAAVSGVLLLALNFWAGRRILGLPFALASTLLLAVLPMNIAYSRFGWEPSQIPLFALFFVVCGLALADPGRSFWLWSAAGAVVALLGFMVHPTLVFLLPILGIGLLARWLRPEVSLWHCLAWLLAGLVGTAVLGLLAWWQSPPWIQPEITSRLTAGAWLPDFWNFLLAWTRLFNGLNTYAYLAGSWPEAVQVMHRPAASPIEVFWLDWLTLLLFAAAFLVLLVSFVSRKTASSERNPLPPFLRLRVGMVLGFGFLWPTLLFWVMNGSGKVAVWFDRYGLWALLPGAWFLCWALVEARRWMKQTISLPFYRLADGAGVVLAGFCLVGFWQWYFVPFLRTGGEAGVSSRTALAAEPKLAAGDFLKEKWSATADLQNWLLLSGDWFAFWPVLYRLQGTPAGEIPHLRVLNDPAGVPILPEDFHSRVEGKRVVIVEFAGGVPWKTWDQVFEGRGVVGEWRFADQSGREILLVREYSRP